MLLVIAHPDWVMLRRRSEYDIIIDQSVTFNRDSTYCTYLELYV